ncbi:hypothetical protein HanXRQr2_Chr10g0463151 [Helianthus annuus]|uniref:Uncharacterized protein n=1 Tax=Helianthus annuus TaxID=4232 RepID=A0A9K3I1K8_HELAN|nr:hypothetical protein HanXRQr2_Chr10g0463151 [Helianthus annuus]KAJ0885597.1 hypothetical protein HanPSC8_Chr10g0446991 [Helianthus annuus]
METSFTIFFHFQVKCDHNTCDVYMLTLFLSSTLRHTKIVKYRIDQSQQN